MVSSTNALLPPRTDDYSAIPISIQKLIGKRVDLGAAWLDQKKPDWFRLVDLGLFDIRDGCRCVIGQLFKEYYLWCDSFSHKHDVDGYVWARDHGFGFIPDEEEFSTACAALPWDFLEEQWIHKIKERVND